MKITENLITSSCSRTIYKRGIEYFKEGRVHIRKREENRISALVDGETIYNVDIELKDGRVGHSFCTCPYYQTMHTSCKHIVAVLKQRQAELEEGGFEDENDKIAESICREFAAAQTPKKQIYLKFTLYINRLSDNTIEYGMSAETDGTSGYIDGIENFLECYARGREFKFNKHCSYLPGITEFGKNQDRILSILAESYLNRSMVDHMYTKAAYRTSFGSKTALRLFSYLKDSAITIVLDGMRLQNPMILEDNPDILTDVDATDEDISLTVSDRGTALTDNGEWFLYENTIYHTDSEWRGYFMPIYRALARQNRMQITFKGNNRISFAKYVMPRLRNRAGVIMQGVEDLIVDTEPFFTVYLDAVRRMISAVVVVKYGSVTIRLPDGGEVDEKIVVRDNVRETQILDFFKSFSLSAQTFTLEYDNEIFAFIKNGLREMSGLCDIKCSDSFMRLIRDEDITLVSTVNYNEKLDLLETSFESNLSAEEICGILSAIRLKKPFYRFADGRFLELGANDAANRFQMLTYMDFNEADIKSGTKALDIFYALELNADGGVVKSESFKKYIDGIKNVSVNIPDELDGILRDYQKEGILWFKQLSKLGFGGILADDMGLGKTLQVLAFVHGERPSTPTLIVTPSSLMYNWANEINRFIPSAKAVIIDGGKERRRELIKNIGEYEFVITSYPILRRDIDLYRDCEFEYFFIDEAQHIKNAHTMSAYAVKKINSKRRFALTGTPVENSLGELWSIFDFIMPGFLYSLHEFRTRFEIPVARENDRLAAAELRAKIMPFIMRRMKSEVLSELPEKIENIVYAELSGAQRDMYTSFLAVARDETLSMLYEGGQNRIRILTLLMRLRQICCHPALFDSEYKKDSGKLNLLLELISSGIGGGHRILVFSQFTAMLNIIAAKLDGMGVSYFYLDGKTPSDMRTEMSEEFNGGKKEVFLISLKAGGMGLNLTGADMVIHFDPWWNPAVTDQASDRAYRIGQKRAVQVIRLAAKDTIEEKILKLQDSKRNLADDIIAANSKTLGALSDEEIISLFS